MAQTRSIIIPNSKHYIPAAWGLQKKISVANFKRDKPTMLISSLIYIETFNLNLKKINITQEEKFMHYNIKLQNLQMHYKWIMYKPITLFDVRESTCIEVINGVKIVTRMQG